jgi:hypothetical protein
MQGYYKSGKADDITVFKDFTAKTLPYGSTCSVIAAWNVPSIMGKLLFYRR